MKPRTQQHGDHFSHSMTDLMAGVAVTFLLVAAIFMVQAASRAEAVAKKGRQATSKLDQISSMRTRAIDELVNLKAELENDADLRSLVQLVYDRKRDPFLLTIVFDRGQLRFDTGDCALREDTRRVMKTSFGTLFDKVCRTAMSGYIQSIALEGHTDNRPFFPRQRVCGIDQAPARCNDRRGLSPDCEALGFANNVRLSAARAQNVFFEVRELLHDRAGLIGCLDTKFVVSGRGPVEPADHQDWRTLRSEAEQERNRRVVIKLRATVPLAGAMAP